MTAFGETNVTCELSMFYWDVLLWTPFSRSTWNTILLVQRSLHNAIVAPLTVVRLNVFHFINITIVGKRADSDVASTLFNVILLDRVRLNVLHYRHSPWIYYVIIYGCCPYMVYPLVRHCLSSLQEVNCLPMSASSQLLLSSAEPETLKKLHLGV